MGSRSTSPSAPAPAAARLQGAPTRRFALGLGRAFAGAILFAFPMLMTMEMWWLGFAMDPFRLALYVLLAVPLLVALSFYAGFEETYRRAAGIREAFAAAAVGFVAATALLLLFSVIGPGMSVGEIVGKIAVQGVPASIGAMLVQSQIGETSVRKERRRSARYEGGLFLMAVGALYLSSSLASTEEMMLISYQMTPAHVVALLVFSLAVMHGFLYAVVAQGKTPVAAHAIPFWRVFLRFTVVGYAIALLVSAGDLWLFGRTDGLTLGQIIPAVVVLGFPASLGAGAARLIL